MNYNELSIKAHENAVNHGFWRDDTSKEHCLMFVITEVSEMIEAHRSRKRFDAAAYKQGVEFGLKDESLFEVYIKGTMEDEMADIVIRLFDLAGSLGVDFDIMKPCRYFRAYNKFKFTENAFGLVKGLMRELIGLEKRILFGIHYVEEWAKVMNVNLEYHVEQKMKYNETRPESHGKLY